MRSYFQNSKITFGTLYPCHALTSTAAWDLSVIELWVEQKTAHLSLPLPSFEGINSLFTVTKYSSFKQGPSFFCFPVIIDLTCGLGAYVHNPQLQHLVTHTDAQGSPKVYLATHLKYRRGNPHPSCSTLEFVLF